MKEVPLLDFYKLPAGHGRKMVRINDFIHLDDERMERYAQRRAEELGVQDQFAATRRIRKVWQALRNPDRINIITIDPNIRRPEDAKSLTEVAEMFVRVNSGGTRLTRSELLFTLLKARWRYAREKFQSLCDELNSRGEFDVDTDFIIRALMVFAGQSARLDLERMRQDELFETFEQIFPRAEAALRSAFDFLTQPTGGAIRTYRLLTGGQRADRGYNVLLPIALYLFLKPTQEIPEGERRRLRRYLYTAIFSRYLVVYIEGHIDRLGREVRTAHQSGRADFPLEAAEQAIQEWTRFGHVSDFFTYGHALDPLLNILNGGQVDFRPLYARNAPERDHIFPKSKLEMSGISSDKINSYANMRLLGKVANILKSNEDPVTAFSDYAVDVLATDYLIPKELLNYDKFDDFLARRKDLINASVDRFLA